MPHAPPMSSPDPWYTRRPGGISVLVWVYFALALLCWGLAAVL